jgi:hypothetical protein
LGKRSISKRITKKNNIMGTFMSNKSHASNLLNYNAVDDKGSAILNAGHGGKGHPHPKPQNVNKPIVNIKASDSLGNMYGIDVRSGSAYEKMYKDLGAVPSAFRPGQGFTEGTDPRTSGLSKEEKAKRLKDAQTRPGGF